MPRPGLNITHVARFTRGRKEAEREAPPEDRGYAHLSLEPISPLSPKSFSPKSDGGATKEKSGALGAASYAAVALAPVKRRSTGSTDLAPRVMSKITD